MRTLGLIIVLAVLAAAAIAFRAAEAGHESPVYPSYYPQEIRIETVTPEAAAAALVKGRIQAYVGTIEGLPAKVEGSVKFVESLGSYVVVRVNRESPLATDRDARCALRQRVISALAGKDDENFRFHPYPVSPLHADYLQHFDLASREKDRIGQPVATETHGLKVRARGALAQRLARPRWPLTQTNWDVSLEDVQLDELLAEYRFALDGWMGPPWLKAGWFHAYLLLAPALAGAEARAAAEARLARLQRGDYETGEERVNLERDFVAMLAAECWTSIAGYATRRWLYSEEYSGGIENIAYDSHAGFRSAIFIRTVKLKDFPWNGWLTLGVPDAPDAAWNPFGGFSDRTGRLIWLTLGDPALFPEPYNSGWNLNRIGDVKRIAE